MDYKDRYEQALLRAKKLGTKECPLDPKHTIAEQIFPELAESEDEKIRKEIIEYLNSKYEDPNAIRHDYDKWIAWLEKQKEVKLDDLSIVGKIGRCLEECERIGFITYNDKSKYVNWLVLYHDFEEELEKAYQNQDKVVYHKGIKDGINSVKSEEWNEEDEKMIESINASLYSYQCKLRCDKIDKENAIDIINDVDKERDWLKSLKDRVQPKQEWGEEDEKMLEDTISCLSAYKNPDISKGLCYQEQIDWLKSLKPQPHWRPSREQLGALNYAYCEIFASGKDTPCLHILQNLIDELKTLCDYE